jgi:hypothetical protein
LYITDNGFVGRFDAGFGSKGDLTAPKCDFGYSPGSGHAATTAPCPVSAKHRRNALNHFFQGACPDAAAAAKISCS